MNKGQVSVEKFDNFRWIVKVFGKYSSRELTRCDLVSDATCNEIAELGQPFPFSKLDYPH
jgi:hypothetical protein